MAHVHRLRSEHPQTTDARQPFDLGSASDPFTTDSLQYVGTQLQPLLKYDTYGMHLQFLHACRHIAVTLAYVHTDSDSSTSFAEQFRELIIGFIPLMKLMLVVLA